MPEPMKVTERGVDRFWVLHQGPFERINSYNSALIWANMLWLTSIVFLPFPTGLLSVRGTGEAAVRFTYIATVLANSAFLLLIEIVMRRSPALWPDGKVDLPLTDGVVAVLLMVVALIVGTAIPALGMGAMLILLATGPLQALVDRRTASSA